MAGSKEFVSNKDINDKIINPDINADINAENIQPVKKLNIFATFKAVAWSFLGVRKSSGHDSDMQNLNPVYVIVAGIISCAIFVGILIIVVNYVVET
jgi:Protein of unknown function (DUF2970)